MQHGLDFDDKYYMVLHVTVYCFTKSSVAPSTMVSLGLSFLR